jgi:hypothetical protein
MMHLFFKIKIMFYIPNKYAFHKIYMYSSFSKHFGEWSKHTTLTKNMGTTGHI